MPTITYSITANPNTLMYDNSFVTSKNFRGTLNINSCSSRLHSFSKQVMTKTMKRSYKLQQTLKSVGESAEKNHLFFHIIPQTQNMLVPLFYQLLKTSCAKQHKPLSSAQLSLTQNICTEGRVFAIKVFFQWAEEVKIRLFMR